MESLMGTPTGPLVEQIDGTREHDIDSIGVGWEEEGRYQAVRPSELSYDFLSHSISQLQPSSSSQRDRERHPGRQLNYDDGSTGHRSEPFINCQNCKWKPPDTNPVNPPTILSLAWYQAL